MAIINKKTGYYGFTTDGMGGTPSDNHGRVTRVLFSIQYTNRVNDVEFTISNGVDDWAAFMGDSSIIPMKNPVVLYQNRDNSIIQFDLAEVYPSNSPCVLVYKSDTAWFNVKEVSYTRPWQENAISGHFGFTVEGYGGRDYGYGCVDRLVCTIPYPNQSTDVEFTMSTDPTHWATRVGDGSVIPLRDPVILFSNRDSAVVQFTMDTPYPSNSPCILIYKSPDAWFNVRVITEELKFIPVENIKNVPATIASGVNVDLSTAIVEPDNASKQGIVWNVVSGAATVNGDTLLAISPGDFVLKGTIFGGLGKDLEFTKNFPITASRNTISIVSQPNANVALIFGEINYKLAINATSTSGNIMYKWFHNTNPSATGATAISAAITSSLQIPTNLTVGDHYYFCAVSSPGAATVNSIFAKVTVTKMLTGIQISPRPAKMTIGQTKQLTIVPTPEGALVPTIGWETSNESVIQVNKDGLMLITGDGSATITARTADKLFQDSITVGIDKHIPVTSLENVIRKINSDTPTELTGTAKPDNATNKTIQWSIADAGSTGATIAGNILTSPRAGVVAVKATITNGAGLNTNYTQIISVEVAQKFISVTDVTIDMPAEIRAGESITFVPKVVPNNATYKIVDLRVTSPGATGATIVDNVLTASAAGNAVITATIVKGASESTNFKKDFALTILPKWVSVESITGIPSTYENVSVPLPLNATVVPVNATHQEITYTLKSASGANATLDSQNILRIDYEHVVWWTKNPNPTPPDFWDQWIEAIKDPIIVEARVKDGVKKGEDFILSINIGITSPPAPSIHIPIDSVSLQMPSILRARRPILMNLVDKDPWNATNQDIIISFLRSATGAPGFALSFIPSQEPPEYWKDQYNINLDPEYDWTKEGYYLYVFEDIPIDVKYTVLNGMPDGTTYYQTDQVEFLPEYIPVKNIINIPTSLPSNAKVYLAPELLTEFPVTARSTETYDVEIPSYSNVQWRVVSGGGSGATFSNGMLTFTGTGIAVIEAEVLQGTHEEYTWYDREFEAVSYKQRYTINVTSSESSYRSPIVTLTLDNSRTVKIYKVCDFYNLCNQLPGTASITVAGETFRKNQITEVKFWDKVPSLGGDDPTIPIENITLAKNSIGVNTPTEPELLLPFADVAYNTEDAHGYRTITDEGDWYSMSKLGKSCFIRPDGNIIFYVASNLNLTTCTPIYPNEYTGSDPNIRRVGVHDTWAETSGHGWYSDGDTFTVKAEHINNRTFEKWVCTGGATIDPEDEFNPTARCTVTGEDGDITAQWLSDEDEHVIASEYVLSKLPGFKKFTTDPSKINFPEEDGWIRYDNSYVAIPEGVIVSITRDDAGLYAGTGDLILPDSTSNNGFYRYIVTLNGIIGKSDKKLPMGCTIGEGYLVLPDGSSYDVSGQYEPGKYEPGDVMLPNGTLFTGDEIIILPNRSQFKLSLISIKPDGNKFYVVLGSTILMDDGSILDNTGSLWNPAGIKENSFTLSSDNVTLAPTNSTGKFKNIKWEVKHVDRPGNDLSLSRIIDVPNGSGATTKVIVPGSDWESLVLTATVANGVGWNGQDYVKRFAFNIGDVSSMGKTVTGINTNYATTLLFTDRWSSQFIDLSASLIGLELASSDANDIQWSRSGNGSENTLFSDKWTGGSTTTSGKTARLRISRFERKGTDIKVKVKVGTIESIITIKMIDEFEQQPDITSLYNFGCNFTKLRKVDRIPDVIEGEDCLRNFLAGCTSFNQALEIPAGVTGDRCLRNFLGGCTTFNQEVIIPENISGNDILNRFLSGCESFNKPITIPAGVTGDRCLLRFLEECKSFNQEITIPATVSGERCLDHFMSGCEIFNKPITIPDGISGVANLRGFMKDTFKMTSTITISEQAANASQVNGLTLVCFKRDDAYDIGIPVQGTGADIFKGKCPNMITTIPLRNLK